MSQTLLTPCQQAADQGVLLTEVRQIGVKRHFLQGEKQRPRLHLSLAPILAEEQEQTSWRRVPEVNPETEEGLCPRLRSLCGAAIWRGVALVVLLSAIWVASSEHADAGAVPPGTGIAVVYVAVSTNYPDSLGVGPGAGTNGAPIIILPTNPPIPDPSATEPSGWIRGR